MLRVMGLLFIALPALIGIVFEDFLHSSNLAIFQSYSDVPVMFWCTVQDVLYHAFGQQAGSLVLF